MAESDVDNQLLERYPTFMVKFIWLYCLKF